MRILLFISLSIASLYFLLLMGLPLYYMYGFGKLIYHDFLGWHSPTDKKEKWDKTLVSKCKYCSKDIFQDSHGFWIKL